MNVKSSICSSLFFTRVKFYTWKGIERKMTTIDTNWTKVMHTEFRLKHLSLLSQQEATTVHIPVANVKKI